MISSTVFLLGSVEAAQGRPLWGWSWMLVFPSLKCFTHRVTQLAPMHTSPYTCWSLWWTSAAGISSLTRNSMTACWQNETLSAILYHLFMVTWCKLLMPYLTQRYDNSWRHLPNSTQLFYFAELPTMWRCSWQYDLRMFEGNVSYVLDVHVLMLIYIHICIGWLFH